MVAAGPVRSALAAASAGLLGLAAPHALGAGGHHAIDDAALLEPQQCQLETWRDRQRDGSRRQLHAGVGCRVAAVELELGLDRVQLQGSATTTLAGVQLKWAQAVHEGWSAGIVLAAARQDRAPRFVGTSLVVPLSWQASETLMAHANLGRDFLPGQADLPRGGLALEWTPLAAWSLLAEGFREGGASYARAGVRWAATPQASVDLSHARGLRAASGAWWTLGLNWVWD